MSLDVSNDWALKSWVLGFGAAVRVIKPSALAGAIADELRRGLGQYQ
jgi:predicted DNA-binding transcriptional regulator YafY